MSKLKSLTNCYNFFMTVNVFFKIINCFVSTCPSVRGRLGTIANYARNFGILMAFTVGAYFDYIYASIVHNGITLLFFATFLIVPSTPQYLLQKNQLDVRFNFTQSPMENATDFTIVFCFKFFRLPKSRLNFTIDINLNQIVQFSLTI